jgi:hypothetical protein
MIIPKGNSDDWPKTLRYDDYGSDVAAWQSVLIDHLPTVDDTVGHFGDTTHNATMNFQRKHRLLPDGVVGPKTRARIGQELPYDDFILKLPDPIPFVEAAHWSRHVPARDEVKWIVIHSMETPESATRAEVCASNFARGHRKASAHYCVDCDSVVQCVDETRIAWHAPGVNRRGIGIEHSGRARQTRMQWMDLYSMSMLDLSAQLVAEISERWSIPLQWVDVGGIRAGQPGLVTHWTVSEAFGKSTHTDPGRGFPCDIYLDLIKLRSGQVPN